MAAVTPGRDGPALSTESTPIHVAHVVFDFNGGGMETLVAEMAARFKGSAVKVSLITMSGRVGRLGEATRHHFEQFHVLKPSRGISMLRPVGVADAIRQTGAEAVHLHTGSWYKGARAARLAGVSRVIYTEHGREHYDPWRNRMLDRQASRGTTAVVAVSKRLERYLHDAVGVDRRKLCTIHNGVDTSVFVPGPAPAELRAALDIPADALIIGSVGRLEPVKAYERLLEAGALMRGTLSRPFVIVIGGDGSQREFLRARTEALGLNDLVRFPGWTEQPIQFYRLLDVFVLSSTSEGQSVSLMEAMSCAVAPVVTDVGANAEMLGDELGSQVVSTEPVVDSLARAIAATVAGPDTLERVGAAVRRRAVELYSIQQMMRQYERLYRGANPGEGF